MLANLLNEIADDRRITELSILKMLTTLPVNTYVYEYINQKGPEIRLAKL